MKLIGILAFVGCACLAVASVVLGGLNQDEGVYVYAANMVRDGLMPYRDFFFTQAPVMPHVYAAFGGAWDALGLLGARLVTCAIGLASVGLAVALARLLVPSDRRGTAGVVTFLLLGSNLYHLYYTAIPKTYALAALFVIAGFHLLALAVASGARWPASVRAVTLVLAGQALAFAAGTRISLGALLATTGLVLLLSFRSRRWDFVWFGLGGALGLAIVYGPVLTDAGARAGLIAAQQYHTARSGFDFVFVVGSLSRLVRWYLPVFVLLGLGIAWLLARRTVRHADSCEPQRSTLNAQPSTLNPQPSTLLLTLALGFGGVFAVQMLAPFPYEDYQVPVMPLLAVLAAVLVARGLDADGCAVARRPFMMALLTLGLTWACSFGSPLLEEWMTNGQDRFWSLKKEKPELLQLQDVAKRIEALDPDGKELLTQDLYLAVECRRRVPRGLELGPFSMLDDAAWSNRLGQAECPVAAFSGYGFAIEPPRCDERPPARQMALWSILRGRYDLAFAEEAFGQNATTLLVLKRKEP